MLKELWASKWVRYLIAPVAIFVAGILLIAFIASGPFTETEWEKPIEPRTRWIQVPGDPFELEGYAADGQMVNISFDFFEEPNEDYYVSKFTVYLIWQDDARTDPDTFMFSVLDPEGKQKAAGSSSYGQAQAPARLNNSETNHVVNNVGWSVEVTCMDAKDGRVGPAGIITIPDDGNEFTVRFDWDHYIEHNPEWQ
ncbi:MAG: hypothetical protein GQ558_06265 [Thermoplasmata archaeon]|nr:hypothetical protein [Thermoplasmata archaeon]